MNPTLQLNLTVSKANLLLAQQELHRRRCKPRAHPGWIRHAEDDVCAWLDLVWEAQEDLKVARRHFA